jgi:Uma2 family endonuclease
METREEIRQALQRLPLLQRLEVEAWLKEWDEGPTTYRVEEARPAYGAAEPPFMTWEEYVEFEMKSSLRHEFVNGFVFAMTGASRPHAAITRNLVVALANRLKGGPCEVYASDLKVRIQRDVNQMSYYPDVVVDCRPDSREMYFLRNPKLIVEVLSPSTHHVDRREKLQNYCSIDSVEEYVLVAQDEYKVMTYRRADRWRPQVCADVHAVVEFHSIDVAVPLTEVYGGVLAG